MLLLFLIISGITIDIEAFKVINIMCVKHGAYI